MRQAADFERTGRRFDRQHRNRASQYLANRNQIELGEMALKRLAKLDDVAYVRFASVYKDFQNIEEFAEALEELR